MHGLLRVGLRGRVLRHRRGLFLVHADVKGLRMSSHGDDVVEQNRELFAQLVDTWTFEELDDLESDGHPGRGERLAGGMCGILIANTVAENDDVKWLPRIGDLCVQRAELVGKREHLPLQRLFPVCVYISRARRDDADKLVVLVQESAHGRQKALRAELNPAVAGIGDYKHGAKADSGFEQRQDAVLQDAQALGDPLVHARVQVGHDAAALQEGGCAARVIPVHDKNCRTAAVRAAAHAHSRGGDRGEHGAQQAPVLRARVRARGLPAGAGECHFGLAHRSIVTGGRGGVEQGALKGRLLIACACRNGPRLLHMPCHGESYAMTVYDSERCYVGGMGGESAV